MGFVVRNRQLPIPAAVNEMTIRRDDPLFPSESILSGAGLKLSEDGDLDLPETGLMRITREKACQLLIGVRCGRNVRSGLHTTPEGHTVVRTGISCSLPAFCCEVRGGELLTMDAPASLVQAVASRRTGSDRLTVTNDGQWLVISRIIRQGRSSSRTWLLLRQLRDISLAEFVIGGY